MNIQLYNNAELTMNNSSMTATGESTSGQSAATNIFLFNNSQSIFNNTNLTATGSSALVTGSTNITAENDSSASVNGGQFSVSMSGAPSAGEPSGAVALWAINNATLSVNNATVTAISGNNETGAVVLQTQNNAVATVNNSLFKAMMEHGNITTSDASPVIAGDNSSIAINNSQIFATMAGATDHDLIMVESISNATIHLNNDEITANNQMTPAGINPVLTIGAGATNASTIYLNEVNFNLSGENTQNTKTWDSGKVIGN